MHTVNNILTIWFLNTAHRQRRICTLALHSLCLLAYCTNDARATLALDVSKGVYVCMVLRRVDMLPSVWCCTCHMHVTALTCSMDRDAGACSTGLCTNDSQR